MEEANEYGSVTQGTQGKTKTERRLAKIKLVIIPAVALTVITLLLMKFSTADNKLLESLSMIAAVVNIALAIFSESLFCIVKMIFLPFRILKQAGTIGFIIAFVIFLFYFPLCLMAYVCTPIVPLLFEKYLCKVDG
ncbi:hypothetical protein [Enterocloster clostridioformis]|uniref:hypothetical protein n=1 Tax=Enterocloster clostridioformis TaxID=1531 RepID=UPI0022E036A7|nr:hypothetical protein [Enterocloster clostridioformis]